MGQPNAQELKGNDKYEVDARKSIVLGRVDTFIWEIRETKRKRVVEKAQILNVIQSISKKPVRRAQSPSSQSVSSYETVNVDNESNSDQSSVKPTRHSLVKGKRALARLKDSQSQIKSADDKDKALSSSLVQIRYRPVQALISHKLNGGEPSLRNAFNFQFGTSSWAEGGYQFEGYSRGDSRDILSRDPTQSNPYHRVFQHQHEDSMEV